MIPTGKFRLPLTALALILAAGLGAGSARAATELPSVIALYGDSITVGYNSMYPVVSGDEGTPTTEMVRLMAGPPLRSVIVDNWGVGATSSSTGLNNMNSFLSQNTSKHSGKAYYVLIMYGTNDFNGGVSASTTGFNNEKMIELARDLDYIPVVGTLTPRDDQLSQVQSRNSQIVAVATAKNALLVDHYGRFISEPGGYTSLLETEFSGLSGKEIRLHPTEAGYQIIAQSWFDDALAGLIEPDPSMLIMAPIISLLLDE